MTNGRAKAAHVYPAGFCKAICECVQEQIEMDEKEQFLIMNVNDTKYMASEELQTSAVKIKDKYKTMEEDVEEELETAWDDVSGAELDPKMVREA